MKPFQRLLLRAGSKDIRVAALLAGALLCGAVLRTSWVGDMEYKSDERYTFEHATSTKAAESWPSLGMPSSVLKTRQQLEEKPGKFKGKLRGKLKGETDPLRNPGMSVWIFTVLARMSRATHPTDLAQAVQVLNCLALVLAAVFAFRMRDPRSREPWLWGVSLACVNPLLVLYHRKIWAQSVLPIFSMILYLGWWNRRRAAGAFIAGIVGAGVGQIHMSGFFLAAGLAGWTWLFDRKSMRWRFFLGGALIGCLPLVPWLIHVGRLHPESSPAGGIGEAAQLRFWVFWVSDSLGLELGNALGARTGNRFIEQLGDFLQYPLLFGQPTYLMAGAHLFLAGAGLYLIPGALIARAKPLFRRAVECSAFRKSSIETVSTATLSAESGTADDTGLLVSAVLIGYGALLTLTTVVVKRYYLLGAFPLESVWLSRLSLNGSRPLTHSRRLLFVIWVAQLLISATFLGYIHRHHGALQGDYGTAYQWQEPEARR